MKEWWRMIIFWIDGVDIEASTGTGTLHGMSYEGERGGEEVYEEIYDTGGTPSSFEHDYSRYGGAGGGGNQATAGNGNRPSFDI